MRPFFDKDILTLVSREELQLMRRCISHRMTEWQNAGIPEDKAELEAMKKLYQDATDILEILPF